MKKIILLFSVLVFSFSFSNGQNWLWGREGEVIGTKNSLSIDVATDIAGNAFITGVYTPGIIFWPDTLIATNLDDIYFTKYNSAGTLLWVKDFPEDGGPRICSDVSNNVIIIGMNGSSITKCDNNGNVKWRIGARDSLGYSSPTGVTTDKFKNIFITGVFYGYLKLGTIILNGNNRTNNIYTIKCDSNGNALWGTMGKCITHRRNYVNQSYGVATDLNGNSIITGNYIDSLVFGQDTLTSDVWHSTQANRLYLVKYDTAGSVLWANQTNLPSASSCDFGYCITTDDVGNIYLGGSYVDTASFGPYTITGGFTYGDGSSFLAKYGSTGNIIWVKNVNALLPTINSLCSDEYNYIYMAGPGGIVKMDTSGNLVCKSALSGDSYMAVDKTGNFVYQVGEFVNVFSPDTLFIGSDTLLATPDELNPYLARWQNCGTLDATNPIQSPTPTVTVFPNPSNGVFTVAFSHEELVSASQIIEVYNTLGEKVLIETLRSAQGDNLIDISNEPNSIYLYRVLNENGRLLGSGKMIIEK